MNPVYVLLSWEKPVAFGRFEEKKFTVSGLSLEAYRSRFRFIRMLEFFSTTIKDEEEGSSCKQRRKS